VAAWQDGSRPWHTRRLSHPGRPNGERQLQQPQRSFHPVPAPSARREGVRLDDAIRDAASQMCTTPADADPRSLWAPRQPCLSHHRTCNGQREPAQPEPDAALEAWNALKDTHNPRTSTTLLPHFPIANTPPQRASQPTGCDESPRQPASQAPDPEVSHTAAGDGLFTLVVNCDLPASGRSMEK